jgi:hypothetical protein
MTFSYFKNNEGISSNPQYRFVNAILCKMKVIIIKP